MSFRIFAAGTARGHAYNYDRADLDIGDIYELASALTDIMSVPTASGAAREGIVAGAMAVGYDEAVGQVGDAVFGASAHQRSLEALGRISGAHLFGDALALFLAQHSPLILFVSVKWDGIFSSGRNVSLNLSAADSDPVGYALRRINPALEEGGLNGFGVLAALARVFTEYGRAASRGVADGNFRLNIDITAT